MNKRVMMRAYMEWLYHRTQNNFARRDLDFSIWVITPRFVIIDFPCCPNSPNFVKSKTEKAREKDRDKERKGEEQRNQESRKCLLSPFVTYNTRAVTLPRLTITISIYNLKSSNFYAHICIPHKFQNTINLFISF